MKIFWFIPTHGDSRYLGTVQRRPPAQPRLPQASGRGGRQPGLRGRAHPHRPFVRRPWVVAASLLPVTRNLKFLVAVRPGLHQPALAGAHGGHV